MINFANGDIFDYVQKDDVVLHQVNCKGVMGGGIAYQIKNMFPDVYQTYSDYCKKHDYNCLSDFLPVKTKLDSISFIIGNCFGQNGFGKGLQTNYDALKNCFEQTKLLFPHNRILIPHSIGCGLAGGDWNIVFKMIENVFADCEVLIVKYNK